MTENQLTIDANATIRECVSLIDANGGAAVLVLEDGKPIGTVSDTDIRKAILRGVEMERTANFIVSRGSGPIAAVRREKRVRDNIAVLMAGGPGQRLRPLTQNCPKPLLKVKGKPLLQSTLENLIDAGFRKVYLAVNYKAEMVKDYFGDGSWLGIEINYLEEKTRLGTAGALGLLPERPSQPLLVMNGDVVTKLNFEQLVDFHQEVDSTATMCVRKYEYQIPYGVIQVQDTDILRLQEKPTQAFFVNAGIYVLNADVLSMIDRDQYLDMPTLFESLMKDGRKTSAFPIREQWIDIGDIAEYERAQTDAGNVEDFVATVTNASPVSF